MIGLRSTVQSPKKVRRLSSANNLPHFRHGGPTMLSRFDKAWCSSPPNGGKNPDPWPCLESHSLVLDASRIASQTHGVTSYTKGTC
jgi:hypothetical protein